MAVGIKLPMAKRRKRERGRQGAKDEQSILKREEEEDGERREDKKRSEKAEYQLVRATSFDGSLTVSRRHIFVAISFLFPKLPYSLLCSPGEALSPSFFATITTHLLPSCTMCMFMQMR